MEFRLFGPVEAQWSGSLVALGPPRARQVLAALLLRAGRMVRVDELSEVLWGDRPPARYRAAIQVYVSQLRRALPDGGPIVTVGSGYRLEVPEESVDLHRFRALVSQARGLDEPARRERLLRTALGLWRGEPMSDLAEEVRDRLTAGLDAERLDALESCAEAALGAGGHTRVVAELSRLVREHPVRERLAAALMVALYRCGRKAEALAVFDGARRILAADLGVDPGDDLRRVHGAVLTDDVLRLAADWGSEPTIAPVPVPAQLPADLADFTGRRDEVATIERRLRDETPGSAAVVVVTGTGGVGKSSLAVHAGHQLSARYPDGQLFADLAGGTPRPRVPAEILASFLRALRTNLGPLPEHVDELAAMFRSTLAGRRVLLVLDDARSAEQVHPLVPAASGCAVLVTSRDQLVGLAAPVGVHRLELSALPEHEAVALFHSAAGTTPTATDPEAVRQVVTCCARLPLALRIAGARLAARPNWTIHALATRLASPARLAELSAGGLTIRSSFELGYQQLEPPAARAFRLMAVPDAPSFSATAAAATLDDRGGAEATLERLVDVHLLRSEKPARYRYHDLLRLYARELGGRSTDHETHDAITRLFGFYLGTTRNALMRLHPATRKSDLAVPGREYADEFTAPEAAFQWLADEWDALVASIVQASHLPAVSARACGALAGMVAQYGELRRDLSAGWHAVASAALDRALADRDRESEAVTRISLAGCHVRRGEFEQSEHHARAALALFEASGNRLNQVRALLMLGGSRYDAGDHHQAVYWLSRAKTAYETHRLDFPRLEALILDALGPNEIATGHHRAGIEHLRRSQAMAEQMREYEIWAMALAHLGDAYRTTGDSGDAVDCFQRSLEIGGQRGNPDLQAVALSGLSTVYLEGGLHDQALDCAERAVEIRQRQGIPRQLAKALHDLGAVLERTGHTERAEACHRQADDARTGTVHESRAHSAVGPTGAETARP